MSANAKVDNSKAESKNSKAKYELVAEPRTVQGKAASRRLRRLENKVPAVLYGGGEAPALLTVDHQKLLHSLENQGFYTHLLTLQLNGQKQQVILKALQRHHFKKAIMHLDLLRVKPTDVITMRVPLVFLNGITAPGVKAGGQVNHKMMDLEIRCQAKDLPEWIEVDLSAVELDQTLYISDLNLGKSVESVLLKQGEAYDQAVVSIQVPRARAEEETPVQAPSAAVATVKETKEAKESKEAAPAKSEKDKGK